MFKIILITITKPNIKIIIMIINGKISLLYNSTATNFKYEFSLKILKLFFSSQLFEKFLLLNNANKVIIIDSM